MFPAGEEFGGTIHQDPGNAQMRDEQRGEEFFHKRDASKWRDPVGGWLQTSGVQRRDWDWKSCIFVTSK